MWPTGEPYYPSMEVSFANKENSNGQAADWHTTEASSNLVALETIKNRNHLQPFARLSTSYPGMQPDRLGQALIGTRRRLETRRTRSVSSGPKARLVWCRLGHHEWCLAAGDGDGWRRGFATPVALPFLHAGHAIRVDAWRDIGVRPGSFTALFLQVCWFCLVLRLKLSDQTSPVEDWVSLA